MPGQICSVSSCNSNRLTLKKKGINLIFHSFPKANDLVSSAIREEWIKRCTRVDKFNVNTHTICSLHFSPNDYQRDLQNELLGLPLRRVLKNTAVPTLNLNFECVEALEKPTEDTPLAKRAEKKQNEQLGNSEPSLLLDMSTAVPSSYTEISDKPSTSSTSDTDKQECEDLLLRYNRLTSNSNKKIKRLNKIKK